MAIVGSAFGQNSTLEKSKAAPQKTVLQKTVIQKDSVRKNKVLSLLSEVAQDTVKELKLKLYIKDAHASYYADKFQGKRTASGVKFNNNNYTAAHRKFPFGTKLKVTNQVNGKSVIVEVTDRGPFSRGREIDLTKKAFMEIAKNKGIGVMLVTIEEVVE